MFKRKIQELPPANIDIKVDVESISKLIELMKVNFIDYIEVGTIKITKSFHMPPEDDKKKKHDLIDYSVE